MNESISDDVMDATRPIGNIGKILAADEVSKAAKGSLIYILGNTQCKPSKFGECKRCKVVESLQVALMKAGVL